MSHQELDSLRKFVSDSLGGPVQIEDLSRSHGRRSVTWRIKTSDRREYYLKRHEHRHHYLAEIRALDEWAQRLPYEPWWSVPKVLVTLDELGVLIVTGLPGLVLDEASVEPSTRTKVHELAGKFANLLHSSRIDPSSGSTLQTYTGETLDRYLAAAESHIDAETIMWVDSVVRRSDAWEGLEIVPVHCDFSPRNWLMLEGKTLLGIIDWERSRHGYYVEDFQRMVQDHSVLEPHLRDAFFSGYGREPSELEWRQANQVVLVNAVGGVPWAASHGDSKFERQNRAVIERLKEAL